MNAEQGFSRKTNFVVGVMVLAASMAVGIMGIRFLFQ